MSETDDKKLDEQIEKINQTEADLLRAMEIQEQMKDFVATAGQSKPADEKTASEADVVEALKTVCDPEIMINVYDMGLIYNIEIIYKPRVIQTRNYCSNPGFHINPINFIFF